MLGHELKKEANVLNVRIGDRVLVVVARGDAVSVRLDARVGKELVDEVAENLTISKRLKDVIFFDFSMQRGFEPGLLRGQSSLGSDLRGGLAGTRKRRRRKRRETKSQTNHLVLKRSELVFVPLLAQIFGDRMC